MENLITPLEVKCEKCASLIDDIYSRCMACAEGMCKKVHPYRDCNCWKSTFPLEALIARLTAAEAQERKLRSMLMQLRLSAAQLTDSMYSPVRDAGNDMIRFIDAALAVEEKK